MEYLSAVLDFIAHNPIAAVIVAIFVFRHMLLEQQERFNEIHDIRKKYINQTLAHMEEILETIVSISYNGMSALIDGVKVACPSGNDKCDYPTSDIAQQMLLYKLQLRDTFLLTTKNKVKISIFENGYHDYDALQLKDYYDRKGTKLYHDVIDNLKDSLKVAAPDVYTHLGENFSADGAIKMFRMVIEKSLLDEENRDKEIEKINKRHSILTRIKGLKKVVSDGD